MSWWIRNKEHELRNKRSKWKLKNANNVMIKSTNKWLYIKGINTKGNENNKDIPKWSCNPMLSMSDQNVWLSRINKSEYSELN